MQNYKIVVFIPLQAKEKVKMAMFQAGAGKIGAHYDQCSFETKGLGQFRPLSGATPAIGSLGTLEVVEEVRVEMIVSGEALQRVIVAMKEAHPYEEVAYDIFGLLN
jgi:hypothetical protein